MRFGAIGLFALMPVFLSGCYISDQPFYSPAEGRQAIADGPYYLLSPTKPTLILQKVGKQAYDVTDGGRTYRSLLIPTKRKTEFIFQAVDGNSVIYGLAIIPDKHRLLYIKPNCSESRFATISENEGGALDKKASGGPVCRFADRASLERALDKVSALNKIMGGDITPLTRRPECAGTPC